MRARTRTGMLMGLSLAGLLVACSSGTSPSATSAPEATPTSIPTATADVTPTPSPVVTPAPTPVSTAAAGCPSDPLPSTLAALDIATRLACYGTTTLTVMAVVVPGAVIIDVIPAQVPARFRQVSPPEYGPLFLVDPGKVFAMETSLGLYVADPSINLAVNFRGNWTEGEPTPTGIRDGGAMVIGHFDDPASADCRRPAGEEWPEITDEQVIQWCRGTFIVTSIQTGG